jgi:hypothetical protein
MVFSIVKRVWRYQRDNQNPYIEEEQTTQLPTEKVQKGKQRSIKHTYKTKDRVTRTPLKTGSELRWSSSILWVTASHYHFGFIKIFYQYFKIKLPFDQKQNNENVLIILLFSRFMVHYDIIVDIYLVFLNNNFHVGYGGRRGRDGMVVGFTTTYAISAYHHWCCEFESRSGRGVQHYVIKLVSNLRQVCGFLRVLRFPPPIKLTATI